MNGTRQLSAICIASLGGENQGLSKHCVRARTDQLVRLGPAAGAAPALRAHPQADERRALRGLDRFKLRTDLLKPAGPDPDGPLALHPLDQASLDAGTRQ